MGHFVDYIYALLRIHNLKDRQFTFTVILTILIFTIILPIYTYHMYGQFTFTIYIDNVQWQSIDH